MIVMEEKLKWCGSSSSRSVNVSKEWLVANKLIRFVSNRPVAERNHDEECEYKLGARKGIKYKHQTEKRE